MSNPLDRTVIPSSPSNPKLTLRQLIAPIASAAVLAGGGTFASVDKVLIEPHRLAAAKAEEREARLLTDIVQLRLKHTTEVNELQAMHSAAHNAMLCEWAHALRANGAAISDNVGGGVCTFND